MTTTADLQLVKRINRSVLLRLLRAQPGQSRAQLAQRSGLTKSTVGLLVRGLLQTHWLSEDGATVAADGMGRPSMPLRIHDQVRVLLGVEIGVRDVRLAAVSLTGRVIASAREPLHSNEVARVCAQTATMVHKAWLALVADGLILSGLGVCLPGAVEQSLGRVLFAPNLGWRDLPLRAMLARSLADRGVPVDSLHLHNDADAAALGEFEFATGTSADPLIFVSCDVGVGAGIVLNDHLFTGARGMAGEIGHSILDAGGTLCSCGRRGCAETFIGARALRTRKGVQRAGEALGVLIQNLNVMFNPGVVVVGGASCSTHPSLLASAAQIAADYADAAGVPAPMVRAARYGTLAAAVGAAAVAWHHALRPMHHRHRGPAALTDREPA